MPVVERLLFWFVALWFFVLPGFSFGQTENADLDTLLKSPTRPTVQQVLELRSKGGLPRAYSRINRGLQKNLLDTVPLAMALIEYTYPGAVFAPLGRDSVIMGDAIEAAYLKLGQPGRSLRVDLSSTSFVGQETNGFGIPDSVLSYLTNIGVDPVRLIKENRKILFGDRTSYSASSQSTRLMRALYTKFKAEGGDPKELFKHLNFLALAPLHRTPKNAASKYMQSPPRAFPTNILNAPGVTDSSPWHDSWGAPQVTPEGKFISHPGKLLANQKEVLSDLFTALDLTQSKEFWLAVDKEFKNMGLRSPVDRALLKGLPKNSSDKKIREIENLFSEFDEALASATKQIQVGATFSDETQIFLFDYGIQLQGELIQIKKKRPDLFEHYHSHLLPKLFESLFRAATENRKLHSNNRLSVFVFMSVLLAPTTPPGTELQGVLSELSKNKELKYLFKDHGSIQRLIRAYYEVASYDAHPLFPAERRFKNIMRIAKSISRESRRGTSK